MTILHENAFPTQNLKDFASRLNSLIGSELIASTQYRIAAKTVVGTDYDACSEEFEKHADEEMDHMKKLMDAAVKREIPVCQDLAYLINCANPKYEVMTLSKSSYLVHFHLQAEEDAIDAYTKFYELIKDVDTVLADEIKEILNDEMEHRSDLKKIISSICGTADK